jgi:hypothetical protein
MLSTELAIFLGAIGTLYFIRLANLWFASLLETINGRKGFKIPNKIIISAVIKTIIWLVVAFIAYNLKLNTMSFIGLLIVGFIFLNVNLIIKANSILIGLRKNQQIYNQHSDLEQKYEFIKGLY